MGEWGRKGEREAEILTIDRTVRLLRIISIRCWTKRYLRWMMSERPTTTNGLLVMLERFVLRLIREQVILTLWAQAF